MNKIKGEYRRKMITIGMLDCNSINAINHLRYNYKICDCVIGMRFHSCIMGLNCRIPTIALAGHEQIKGLFEELSLDHYIVLVDNIHFGERLLELVNECIANKKIIIDRYNELFDRVSDNLSLHKSLICNLLKQSLN